MKRFTQYTVALMAAIGVMHPVCAGERELSYAIEDTSFQAVMQLTSDVQGKAKNIAFVKLTYPNSPSPVPNWRNLVSVFETSLVKDKPQGLSFVTHADKTESWTEIDKVFDAVTDFEAASRIYRRCRHAGVTPRGMVDCMIAAVAYRRSLALLSWDADLSRVAEVIGIELDGASLRAG